MKIFLNESLLLTECERLIVLYRFISDQITQMPVFMNAHRSLVKETDREGLKRFCP